MNKEELKKRILVIEDEEDIREILVYNLERDGYQVLQAGNGEEGLDLLLRKVPQLILLDIMLPGMDGLEVLRKLRNNAQHGHIPVIMLTAKGEEADVVAGLELGADDYVVKPFSPRVLLARIKALLRRKAEGENELEILHFISLTINPVKQEVICNGKLVELTRSEFRTLHFLARRPGWVFTRYQIVNAVHGEDYPVTDRAIDVMMVNLRKKLDSLSHLIETVRGVGYRFKEGL